MAHTLSFTYIHIDVCVRNPTRRGRIRKAKWRLGLLKRAVTREFRVNQLGMIESGITKSGISKSGMTDSGMTESGMTEPVVSECGIAESGISESGISGFRDKQVRVIHVSSTSVNCIPY